MHALPVNLPCVKQLPVITNEAGASPHAGSTCAIGVVTVRPFNRQPAQLYFKLTPDPNNTFFFIFTCTTQYPWVLANPDLSQAMASSKQKRTHTVFRASSTHRSASTSKPRFVGEKVRLGDVLKSSSTRNKDNRCANVYSVTNSKGFVPSEEYFSKEVFSKELRTYRIVARNMLAYNPSRINVGSVALQDKADEVVVSPLYVVFSTDTSKLMPEYLVHFLKSKPGLDQIAFQSIGTVRNNLKYKALCQMELRIPSLGEQQARLNTLREVQLQIEQAESQIAELDQLAKSRFVEMFASGGFPSVSFGDVCLKINNGITRRGNDPDGDIVLRLVELQEGFIDYAKPNRIRLTQKEKERFSLVDGELLFARVNGNPKNVGRCASFSAINESVYHNDHVIRATFDHSKYNPVFLVFFMNSSKGRAQIEAAITTSAGQCTINQAGIKSIQVPLPPLAFQQEFAAFVSQVDKSRFVRDHEINFR